MVDYSATMGHVTA